MANLNWKEPGPKEFLIVGAVALGGFLLWFKLHPSTGTPASASTGTPADTGAVSTSPTGLSLAQLLLWIQDHTSSSTTTTTTTTGPPPKPKPKPKPPPKRHRGPPVPVEKED